MTITVVGGGLAGLIASIECAERGNRVRLLEATSLLGGRARSSTGAFVANHGPHVVYQDGALWSWLDARGLADPAGKAPLTGVRFRRDGKMTRTPPLAAVQVLRRVRRETAPNDRSFRAWMEEGGCDTGVAGALCHVFTFHHDPGSLAADFVAERARRAFALPPAARYIVGGWSALVDRLVGRAGALGVELVTGARVDELPESPVIVATPLRVARQLLGDDSIRWTGTRTALLDIGLTSRRGDPFVVFDLDEGVFAERYTVPDRTLAPNGSELIQAQVGLREDEDLETGVAQIEAVLDATHRDWRTREVWRRRQLVTDSSGAVDLPGRTWRDRPQIDRGDGVFLCGDMVAAPGLLGEVSCTSAVTAAELATAQVRAVA